MPSKRFVRAVTKLAGILVVFGLSSCSQSSSGSVESIILGLYPHEANASIYVAEDQGLFNRNGLQVTERNYDSGLSAVNGLLDGNVDVALTSEYIVVGTAFRKEGIRLIGNIRKGWSLDLVGRQDRGIDKISDLKGKKIGVPLRTNAEFFLDRFLTLNGMRLQDVTLVDVKASPNIVAIMDGSVDAIVVASNSVTTIREKSSSNVVTWSAQGNQAVFWLLACRNDWIAGHAQIINQFLKSLDQANDYIIRNPSAAKAIVQKRMNYDAASMDARWSENQFALSLDESLIAAMEDEARWMIANDLTTEKQVPNFLNYIYLDGLLAVKPEAVNVIR